MASYHYARKSFCLWNTYIYNLFLSIDKIAPFSKITSWSSIKFVKQLCIQKKKENANKYKEDETDRRRQQKIAE